MITALLLLAASALAQDVVITNDGDQVMEGLTVSMGGATLCTTDLAVGYTIRVDGGQCKILDRPKPQQHQVEGTQEDMRGRATVSGGFGPARRIGIYNHSDFPWTGCSVTLNGQWTYPDMKRLQPGAHEGIMGQRFVDTGGNFMTRNASIRTVSLSCDQGQLTLQPE